MRAYGLKRPQDEKLERSKSLSTSIRTYPLDKAGNIDEWAAVMKGQRETLTALERQQQQ